jgi:regulator of sigma D
MGEQFSGEDRRSQTSRLVKELLAERQQMWTLYCKVAGLEPFTPDKPVDALLKDFCQVLVDYISLGHFGLYEKIMSGEERRQKVVEVAERIYPQMSDVAARAVEFNDMVSSNLGAIPMKKLSDELSYLGEGLATRIELEDQLLETINA